jgi:hypothetical protein
MNYWKARIDNKIIDVCVSSIVTAFDEATIGTKVVDHHRFVDVLLRAISNQ